MSSVKINLTKLKKDNLIKVGKERGINFKSTAKKQNLINGLEGKLTKFIKTVNPKINQTNEIKLIKMKKENLIKLGNERGMYFKSTAKKQNLVNGLLGKPSAFLKTKPHIKKPDLTKLTKQNLIKLGKMQNIFFPDYTQKRNMINTLQINSPFFVDKPKVIKTKYNGTTLMRYLHMLYLTLKRNNIFHSLYQKKTNYKFLSTFSTKYLGYVNLNYQPQAVTYITRIHINKFNESKKQFFIIPIFIEIPLRNSAHMNMIIYNKQSKELEYFEPHGLFNKGEFLKRKKICEFIKKDLISKNLEIKKIVYINKKIHGPQHFNVQEKKCQGDPAGFCQVWSFWFTDYRLKHSTKSAVQLAKQFTNDFQKDKKPFKSFIRNYGEQIVFFKNEYASECEIRNVRYIPYTCIDKLQKLYSKIF